MFGDKTSNMKNLEQIFLKPLRRFQFNELENLHNFHSIRGQND
jgi:hypothetical protein